MGQESKDYIDEIAKKLSTFIENKIEENGHCSLYEANKEMYRLLNGGEELKLMPWEKEVMLQLGWTD